MCKDQQELDHDSVYTQYTLTVDSTFGGCPSGARDCSKYGACNPTDPTGTKPWKCFPEVAAVGKADIRSRLCENSDYYCTQITSMNVYLFVSIKHVG